MRWEEFEDGVRVLAPAKINLYLEVGPCRDDGFHDIDSLFQAVTLFDELEVAPDESLSFEAEGMSAAEDNLVYRAAALLQRESGTSRGASMRLRKRIPQGAGLGGGSSDAAAALVALRWLWELDASDEELARLAATLGSDVPFFLVGGTARCQGRGERVEPMETLAGTVEDLAWVLVYPRTEISTALVYKALDDSRDPDFTLTVGELLDSLPDRSMRDKLRSGELYFNRLEGVVFSEFPELERLRDRMADESFVTVMLSGSGSTLLGACRSAEEADRAAHRLSAELDADIFSVRAERSASAVVPPGFRKGGSMS